MTSSHSGAGAHARASRRTLACLRSAAALLALVAAAPAAAQTRAAPATPAVPPAADAVGERLFYHVDGQASYESFVANVDRITVVAPQSYTVDSLGIVFGHVDRRVLALARARGVKVMPLLVNEGFHQPSLRRLLADTAAQGRAVRTLVNLCRTHGYWGIQFDVENVNVQDRDRFTAFYRRAADALHGAGYAISVAVVPRASDDAGETGYERFLFDSWRGAFDLPALARIGDFVSFMTYDQHTRRTAPGPVAGLPWMRAAVDYALRSVPPERLSLGIPLYGRHWFTRYDGTIADRGAVGHASVSWAWGSGLAERAGGTLQWDAAQGTTWGHFERGGMWEWVFLEDARAFDAKLAMLREKRLRGFSAWVLGQEDRAIWERLPPRAEARAASAAPAAARR
jgi:spore germination protein YaaH